MKTKLLLCVLAGAVLIGIAVNSCKKSSNYLPTLLTNKQWQLASVQVYHYTGALQDSVVTLDTTCSRTQIFRFNSNNTCTYTNFDCIPDSANGHWSFSTDHLYLNTDMICKDTSSASGGNSVPFKSARIINLGQYSLVLQTGNLDTYYSPTQKRIIYQWGFVRVKTE